MSNTIFLSVASLCYIFILVAVYFTKSKIKSSEMKVFSRLLIISLISLCSELYITIIPPNLDMPLFVIALKLYLILCVLWLSIFMEYVFIITRNDKQKIQINYKDNYKKLYLTFWFIIVLVLLSIIILPIDFFNEGGIKYSFGPSVNVVFGISAVYILIMVFCVLKNIKQIKNNGYSTIIILIILMTVVSVVQKNNPGLLLANTCFALITSLMYYTIENPDIKMAKEIEHQRKQIEEAKSVSNRVIDTISNRMGKTIDELGELGHMKVNYDDEKEVKDTLEKMQKVSSEFVNNIGSMMELSRIQSTSREIKNDNYELNQLLNDVEDLLNSRKDNVKIIFSKKNAIPPVLYGDADKIKASIIYLYSGILKVSKVKQLDFNYSYLTVGNLCRFKLKINIDSKLLSDNTNLKLKDTILDFEVVDSIMKLLNGKFDINYVKDKVCFEIVVDQKNMKDYYNEDELVDDKKIKYFDLTGANILIIDDDKDRVDYLTKIFEKYNINVKSAYTKEDVDKKISDTKFDLVFVDDIIPNLNDIKLFLQVDNQKKISRLVDHISYDVTRVIMVTPNNKEYELDYIDDGFDDYMIKPISEEKINEILNTHLKK